MIKRVRPRGGDSPRTKSKKRSQAKSGGYANNESTQKVNTKK